MHHIGTGTDDTTPLNNCKQPAFGSDGNPGNLRNKPLTNYHAREPHIQGFKYETYCVNKAMYRPPPDGRKKSSRYRRPVPDSAKNVTQSPSAYDATIVCDACGLRGHPAARCFTLASAVFVDKYIADDNNSATVQRALDFWIARNAPLIRDNATNEPIKDNSLHVMHAYASRQEMSVDEIMDEIDWQFFDEDSTVQEVFGIMGGQKDGEPADNE